MQDDTLSLDKSVYRRGDAVCRPVSAATPAIHSLLRHLHSAGLPVPAVLSDDDNGQAILSYLPGEQVHPNKWSDAGLAVVAVLVRRLHDATRTLPLDGSSQWAPWCLREIGGPARILCHGDIAPWNVITKDGLPIGLIDWEFAGPLNPLVELARVCWLFPQLHDDDLAARYGLPSAGERARQVRLMADAYGLDADSRGRLLDQVLEVIVCETAHEAIDANIRMEDTGPLWGMAWRTRSLYWLWRHRDIFHRALQAS